METDASSPPISYLDFTDQQLTLAMLFPLAMQRHYSWLIYVRPELSTSFATKNEKPEIFKSNQHAIVFRSIWPKLT